MNRGFSYYFNKNVRAAAKTALHGGNLFKFYIGLFAELLCAVIPFLGAVAPVAFARKAQIAVTENSISPLREFGSADGGKSFGAALLSGVIKLFVLLGGIIAIGVLGGILFFVGAVIGLTAEMAVPELLGVIFAIPAAAGVVIYAVAVLLLFAPCSYLLNSHNGKVSATEVLTASVETMKRGGKGTCFLNAFIPYLIISAFGSLIGGGYTLLRALTEAAAISDLVCGLWLAVTAVAFLVFAPVFMLTHIMSNYELFKDIALDPTALYNDGKGVFIKRVKTNGLARRGLDENLLNLFEREPAVSVPPPDTAYTSPFEVKPQMHEYTEPIEPIEPPRPEPIAHEFESGRQDSYKPEPENEPPKPDYAQFEPQQDESAYGGPSYERQSAPFNSGEEQSGSAYSESDGQTDAAQNEDDSDLNL